MKLLVVDDERSMAESVRDNLEFEGFAVDSAFGGREAIDRLLKDQYRLIILDVMMPDVDGFEVLSELRRTNIHTPVIFLTARAAEKDKLRGLGLGADDYVVKPFSILELIARVKAILKRTAPGAGIEQLKIGGCIVDFMKSTMRVSGKEQELGRYEADILRLLSSEPGRIFSREEILDQVWGINAFPSNRTVDNYIVTLRRKLEGDPKNPAHLFSVYGRGYKLIP